VGINLELDMLRFMQLVLGWKGMQAITPIREILTYPEVSGTDKVDLLCEMAAFAGFGPDPLRIVGLDLEANAKALQKFLDAHLNDKQFLQTRSDGTLTMSPADTRWRKEWLRYYNEEVARRAQVAQVPVGAATI
jgi:hypothetical protein